MTTEKAIAILKQAQETGIFPDPIPESESDAIREAIELVTEAKEAYEKGAKGDAVKSLLTLAEFGEECAPSVVIPTQQETKPQTTSSPESASMSVSLQSDIVSGQFSRLINEGLPIPNDVSDPPELPRDISLVDERTLRSLHARFNSVLARANWLLAVEEADELAAKQTADFHEAKAVREAGERLDPVTNKPKTVAVLSAEAASNVEVQEWRGKQIKHHIKAKLLRALRDTYQSNCERCSRDWTMRYNEKEYTR